MKKKYLAIVFTGLISFPFISNGYTQKIYTGNSLPAPATKQTQVSQIADDIQAEDAKAQLNKVNNQVHGQDTISAVQAAHGMN
ncbi:MULTISPECIES: hypothetical protein [unclassified Francisella]|uniref:hypothetical protein n=1 Tax=unclassified Francisella TaxID=2610885 RepID=UPI002E2F4048|nr:MULTISPECIES: hypothetical protein [unclassified Francisella]MED7818669.1 hypothetical protein [Francisella sp. 19S2-4]MED7829505.1 hypothetical protein [Francisella sp. 19S2-10]